MFSEAKEIFSDDYIKVGSKKVRPFSIAWWMIRIGGCAVAIAGMYAMYCAIWMIGA